MIDYVFEVECRRMSAKLSRAGCLNRQFWSLTHADDPFAAACWDCPEALPNVKEAGRLILQRRPSQRFCLDCGIRDREVTWDGRVLELCPVCRVRRWRARYWGEPEETLESDTTAGEPGGPGILMQEEEPLRPILGGAM